MSLQDFTSQGAKGCLHSHRIRTQMNVAPLCPQRSQRSRGSNFNISAAIPSVYMASTIPVSGKIDAPLPVWLTGVTHNQPSTETQSISMREKRERSQCSGPLMFVLEMLSASYQVLTVSYKNMKCPRTAWPKICARSWLSFEKCIQ